MPSREQQRYPPPLNIPSGMNTTGVNASSIWIQFAMIEFLANAE